MTIQLGTPCEVRCIAVALLLGLLCCFDVDAVATASDAEASEYTCYPSVFVFGDSRSDVGEVQASLPFSFLSASPPYGSSYFGRPVTRFSDGRLPIDFLAQAFNIPFLSAYLQGINSDFRKGINFAASSGNARPVQYKGVIFHLQAQVQQYKWAKHLASDAGAIGDGTISKGPVASSFDQGLHIINIGENDYRKGYFNNLSYEEVAKSIPDVVGNITLALENLYESGARKFLVFNIPSEGCKGFLLAQFPGSSPGDYDRLGCLRAMNNITQQHNARLKSAVDDIRGKHPDALFMLADDYGFNLDLIENPEKYGFKYTIQACCGVRPTPYNYDPARSCGHPDATVCSHPSEYISWDGIHPTEHQNRLQALAFLSGRFIDPPGALAGHCKPNFTDFKEQIPVADQR